METGGFDLENLHPLIRRQIKKHLSAESLSRPDILSFIRASNDSYLNYERDKELFEHSAYLNELEFIQINERLTQEVAQRNQSFEKLIEATESLETPEGYSLPHFNADNLLGLVDFLKKQIEHQKSIEIELIQAKEAAESATKAKSDFLSVMSHEIRTPLNAILGLVYFMKEEECPPAIAENLDILQFSADNLHVLINDILDFSKIEAGKVELEMADFDFKHLVGSIGKSYGAKAEENGDFLDVQIDDDVPPVLIGDALRLNQVISNLVSNAVKFTKNGKVTVRLQLESIKAETAHLFVSVEDTGIGIPLEQQERIFELFTQASSMTTRRFGGSGLGLVITRRLLELFHTEIQLESKPGKGSKFFFKIALKIGKTLAPKIKSVELGEEKNQLEGVRLLSVEDYIVNAKIAIKFFERWKIDYDLAENGLIAVEMAARNKYDVILMDLQMPVMDGYTATRHIRTFNSSVPIIALTASATLHDKDRSFVEGTNDFIPKPFNPKDLFSKIARYSGRG